MPILRYTVICFLKSTQASALTHAKALRSYSSFYSCLCCVPTTHTIDQELGLLRYVAPEFKYTEMDIYQHSITDHGGCKCFAQSTYAYIFQMKHLEVSNPSPPPRPPTALLNMTWAYNRLHNHYQLSGEIKTNCSFKLCKEGKGDLWPSRCC